MNKVIVVLICLLAIPCQARIIYVDDDANGLNDGSSWQNAYNYLQDALADANSSAKPVEICVAQGIYRPDRSSAEPNGTGDRTATFQLINGVTLKGGYVGFSTPDPNARDIEQYETILSGDLDSNDIKFEGIESSDFIYSPSRSENSYTVVTGSGTDSTAVLDGFTITGGNSNGQYGPEGNGGGMYNHCGNPTVVNCTFQRNSTRGRDCCFPYIGAGGGGVFNLQSSPMFRNCCFEENLAYGADVFSCGGGMYDVNSQPTMIGCTFASNVVYGYDSEYYGGAIFDYNSSTVLTDCSFIDNWSHSGGALYSTQNSSAKIRGCLFAGNYAYHGGGAILSSSARLGLANCTFTGNRAPYSATIDCEHWEKTNYLKAINSILWDGGDEVSALLSDVQITFSDIQGGWEGQGNINLDPCFVQPGHWDDNGTPDTDHDDFWINGDYHLLPGSPCINAGDPNYIAEPNETDLDGRPRVIGGRIDMGAYEFRAPRTLYVDDDATGANNGSSWVDAYKYLQDALAVAKSGDEIRVAQGIYRPDRSSAEPNGTGDRTATFQLINGVTLKGGYAGFGQPYPNVRNIDAYKTILSGDLDGNDELTDPSYLLYEESRQENSYHILAGSGTDSSSVLSGCTIVGGQAYSEEFQYLNEFCYGGGLYIISGSPAILNCTFRTNAALEYGGGMHIDSNSAPSIVGCIFSENSATDGGGMNSNYSSPMITKCLFTGNAACSYNADGGDGAGMYNYESQSTINSCMFIGNSSDRWGAAGGMYNNKSTVTVKNCIFADNSAGYVGGLINGWSNLTLTNCTFHRNNSLEQPGAICNYPYNAYIKNCILWGDTPNEISGENLLVNYSDIQGGWPGQGNINADPCFVDGCFRLKWGSPCIDTGDPNYVPEPNEKDLDGISRVVCNAVDMGAYEYHTVIGYSPGEFEFEWEEFYRGVPSEQDIEIYNCGKGTLNWEIMPDCNWLQVYKSSGSQTGCGCSCVELEPNAITCNPTGTENTVWLSIDSNYLGCTNPLKAGKYDCNLVLSDCHAINNPQRIPVTLIIKENCFPDGPEYANQYANFKAYTCSGHYEPGDVNCWCGRRTNPPWPYQCDGDADNDVMGLEGLIVYTNDFNRLVANWKKVICDPALNPCADFDHKPQGLPKYRVYTNDFNILVANWKKTKAQLPGNCPRPE